MNLTVQNAPPLSTPDLEDPEVQVWRDPHHGIWAYVCNRNSENWLHFPRVGRFYFTGDSQEVSVIPQENISQQVIEDVFHRAVVPLVLQAQGTEVLHASALVTSKGVLALCAPSGTGKSTTAYALSRLGYQPIADDALPFVVQNGSIRITPLPFRLRLWPETDQFFTKQPGGSSKHDAFTQLFEERMVLSSIVLLKKDEDLTEETRMMQLTAPDAFTEVLTNSWWFSLAQVERKRRMIANYMQLVASVPVVELRFQPGLHLLSHLTDAIQQVIFRSAMKSA